MWKNFLFGSYNREKDLLRKSCSSSTFCSNKDYMAFPSTNFEWSYTFSLEKIHRLSSDQISLSKLRFDFDGLCVY
jgi:hypothetical protein